MLTSADRITTYALGVFLLLGVIFLAITALIFYRQQAFIAESERGTGQVVEMILDRERRYTAPVVAYAWQGQEMTQIGAYSRGIFKIRTGDEVPLYIHRHTGEALIDTFGERWLTPSILSLLGVAFIVMPLWVGYKLRQGPAHSRP